MNSKMALGLIIMAVGSTMVLTANLMKLQESKPTQHINVECEIGGATIVNVDLELSIKLTDNAKHELGTLVCDSLRGTLSGN